MSKDANAQALELFNEFKRLHPNNKEEFVLTLDNLHRWNWHVKQSKEKPKIKNFDWSAGLDAQEMAKSRAFVDWADLPDYMKSKYIFAVSLFPQYQFYAVGSRINGEYVETFSDESIREMRKELGKAPKHESDYDVWFDAPDIQTAKDVKIALAGMADVLLIQNPKHKIAIAMWDWSKLPESEHGRVIQLFNEANWGELMLMHNTYKISDYVYCCDSAPIIRYFKSAIDNGIIKA